MSGARGRTTFFEKVTNMKRIILISLAIIILVCVGGAGWVVSNARSSTADMKDSALPSVEEASKIIFAMTADGSAKTKDGEIWVNPVAWGLLSFEEKKFITYTAAVRAAQDTDPLHFKIRVVNSLDGTELAKWNLFGFKIRTK